MTSPTNEQPDAAAVHAQFDRVVGTLIDKLLDVAADHLDQPAPTPSFTVFAKELLRQVWSNNPNERLNRETRRRTDDIGICPDRDSVACLAGAVLAAQHDEWAQGRRHLGLDVITRAVAIDTTADTTADPDLPELEPAARGKPNPPIP